ncbi:phytanoyl-CoA dioxygenase family protein [Pseudoalteromonas sp. MMG005]|uniref:phytanoyl-CoA dioxygenase family protein n=1 Tax=Pseudoalteromonas sp. MMG005 TaxID=2822682 RepID=UPI001B3A6F58|nr:phytanoyl-CoA dioxygenase family protein [Pseudoalteromonas sp. MMG005]MBQ4846607.1 phytanoyl-CoA dioxygenase family protein [Pseudoalteromonas sp. MMG005]
MKQQWQNEFSQQGYIVIEQGIEAALLAQLQVYAQQLLFDAKVMAMQGKDLNNIAVYKQSGQLSISRINDLFRYQVHFASLLTHLNVLNVAEALIGEPVLPVYESLVIKDPINTESFDWHRDMAVRSDERIVTMGIYLDDSLAEQGALKVIPGSQVQAHSVCEFKEAVEQGSVASQNIAVKAGDVVIHHVNTVHGSDKQLTNDLRRTIYFEFRAVSHLKNNPRFSEHWLNQRVRLMEQLKSKATGNDSHAIVLPTDFYQEQLRIEPAEYCFKF